MPHADERYPIIPYLLTFSENMVKRDPIGSVILGWSLIPAEIDKSALWSRYEYGLVKQFFYLQNQNITSKLVTVDPTDSPLNPP